jgi:hypothetical protein
MRQAWAGAERAAAARRAACLIQDSRFWHVHANRVCSAGAESSSRVLGVLGPLERGEAQAAHDRAILDLLGRELEAAGLGLARARDSNPPPAPLGRLAGPVVALVLADPVCATRPGGAGQVDQEREPGRVDPGHYVGVGVVGGLPVQRAMRPAGDLVRYVGAAQAQLGRQGDEPLVV